MKLLFVKSSKMGSRIIRWGTKSKSSHFAVCFDEDYAGNGIIFHSYGKGAQLEWFGNFMKKYEIVYALEFKAELALTDEESIYRGIIRKFHSDWYDFSALAWWFYRGVLNRFFGISWPKKNLWAKKGHALCTAIAGGIEWIRKYADEKDVDLEMISPDNLALLIKESGYFKNACQEWVELMNASRGKFWN